MPNNFAYGSQGMLGDRYTGGQGSRLAALLARQNVNNGTTAGGIANVLQQAIMGMALKGDADAAKQDRADQAMAGQEMARGMSAKEWKNPDMGGLPLNMQEGTGKIVPTGPAGGIDGGLAALGNMPNNPYAGRLSSQLMMGKVEQDAKMAAAAQAQKDAMALKAAPGWEKPERLVPGRDVPFPPDVQAQQLEQARARANSTNVTVGGDNPADAALRKKLSEKEGERWSGLKEAGTVSAGLGQDFEALDQLMTVAPQGPITGRLAEAFPGFSSAGDAFQSIVTRVAPTLRTPGSGATSDIEYEGMLKSLPRLRFKPEANRAIGEMMKAKSALNVERSQIITAYENQQMDAATARAALETINKKSIISPELKSALGGLTGPAEPPKPGMVQDGYRFRGGNPADPNSWEKL